MYVFYIILLIKLWVRPPHRIGRLQVNFQVFCMKHLRQPIPQINKYNNISIKCFKTLSVQKSPDV